MGVICYLLILLCSWLEGTPKEAPITSPIITQVDVALTTEGQTLKYSYQSDEDMEIVLNYLRYLDPHKKTSIDPDTFLANHWEIVVWYADGNSTVYRQVHREYLQKDGGIWRQIDTDDDLLFLFS